MPTYKDHDIYMSKGEMLLHCFKTGLKTYNSQYIRNKICPSCGNLKLNGNHDGSFEQSLRDSIELAEKNKALQEQEKKVLKTVIICNKCELQMEQTSPGIFYCENGHKKMLMDLVEAAKQEAEQGSEKTLKGNSDLAKQEKRSRKIQLKCPYCGKVAEVTREDRLPNMTIRKYSCGHTQILDKLTPPLGRDEVWNKLYEFQKSGVEFVENADYQAQIGDEMGLGKTIQALAALRYNYEELTPCLIVCESSKVYDWKEEFRLWVSDKFTDIPDTPIIHKSGKYGLVPAFKNHIISMSLLQKPDVLKSILAYGFKFMIVDESHSFKNEDAERTYALQQIARAIPYKLFLSGTPIMNRVMEYFVPLNILRPSHFPSKDYLTQRCDRAPNGRVLGLSKWYRPKFFSQISDYVIRRTKKDAGIKLPEFRNQKHFIALDDDKMFIKGYNNIVNEIEKALNSKTANASMSQSLLGLFAQLRHITGITKVKPIINRVNEFLESTDSTDKITIGVHHKLVMDYLEKGLAEYNPICVSDESPEIKMQRIDLFKRPERRVLIASILGAGQGLNIQFCKNAIIAEREWNPAKEDQFCGRFHRIVKNADGSYKTDFVDGIDSVTVDTLNASGTIDEFFDKLLELKKHIVGATLDQDFSYDPDFLMELARLITANRLASTGS